jgi:hypothetical protein
MAFTEDLNAMFDAVYGFAVTAEYDGTEIMAIFEAEYYAAPGQEVDIESTKPAAFVRSVDVPGVKIGDAITVDGTEYVVINVKPDGTGVTTIALEEA